MKKNIILLCTTVILIVLSGCKSRLDAGNPDEEFVDSVINHAQLFNFAAFANQLEACPILDSAYKYSERPPSWLSVGSKYIRMNGEFVAIYAYGSVEDAKRDAGYISRCGFSIHQPNPAGEGFIFHNISWVSWPYWFMRDLIIVRYVGECDVVINILKEVLGDNFAGYGVYDNHH